MNTNGTKTKSTKLLTSVRLTPEAVKIRKRVGQEYAMDLTTVIEVALRVLGGLEQCPECGCPIIPQLRARQEVHGCVPHGGVQERQG